MMIFNKKTVQKSLLAMALTALTASTTATAQTEEQAAAEQPAISETPALFSENDPNLRRATAIVNGEIITGTDIDQRVALLITTSGGTVPEEEMPRLRLQVLRNLIDEVLQIQEAAANDITIPKGEIDQTYARVAQSNFQMDPAALNEHLRKNGSSAYSLKRQIIGELAWNRLLGRNVQPFINVSEEEVQAVIDRLEASKGTEEYRIGEIYRSATPNNAVEVAQNMRQLMEQIQQGGSFAAYARQFSEASTAASNGDLGWVQLNVLPAELANAARAMQVGQLVGPVEIPGGFSIIYLIDKRQVLSADPRDAKLSLKQLAISFEPGVSEADATSRAAQFSEAAQQIRGCGDAERVATELGASIVDNDNVRIRELPGPLQSTLLNMTVGEATQPFGSIRDGVRVLVLCGRDDPEVNSGPSFEETMRSMEDERVNKRAQIYLRDLRRDAVVEYN